MSEREDDLAVLRERLEDLQRMLADAELQREEAEEAIIWMADQPAEDLQEYEDALAEADNRCESLRAEIDDVELSISQLENDEDDGNSSFFG